MKKIIMLIFVFIFLVLLSPSEAKASSITIRGGDYSGATSGEGEGMRINITTSRCTIKSPGTVLELNDLRQPKDIPGRSFTISKE